MNHWLFYFFIGIESIATDLLLQSSCSKKIQQKSRERVLLFRHFGGFLSIRRELWGKGRKGEKENE